MRGTRDDETDETVLLLIEDDRNRELLAEQIGQSFAVQTGEDAATVDESDFDLCLLDAASLGSNLADLRTAKRTAEPTFLPALLLTEDRSPDGLPEDVWDVVDEVIQRPMNRAELDARLTNLLRRRRLSLELTREKEQSERRFQSLFESTPDPVVVLTPDGTISEANDAFAETFGYEHEEVAGRSIESLEFSPAASVERVLLRIAEEEPATTTLEWGDGEDSLVTELNTDVVTRLEGAVERIGIFRDVTGRVERRRELERQNERLEEFAGTVAHDLRNPLSIAQGHLELAQATGRDEHFEEVEGAHDRMEELIEELLSLAKQGRAVLDPDPVPLEDVVEAAWETVRTPEASLAVEADAGTAIVADETRVRQLLENLFRNAVDHAGEGVAVTVGTLSDRTGFYVEDDGPGIPPEEREAVLDAGHTTVEDGTGFGLSIVNQIVQGHDWDVTIAEGTEGGARFEMTGVTLQSTTESTRSADAN